MKNRHRETNPGTVLNWSVSCSQEYKVRVSSTPSQGIWTCQITEPVLASRHSTVLSVHSVAQSCPTFCMPGFPVRHQFPQPAQTPVHQVGDTTPMQGSVHTPVSLGRGRPQRGAFSSALTRPRSFCSLKTPLCC